jgi:hypothetical protein
MLSKNKKRKMDGNKRVVGTNGEINQNGELQAI